MEQESAKKVTLQFSYQEGENETDKGKHTASTEELSTVHLICSTDFPDFLYLRPISPSWREERNICTTKVTREVSKQQLAKGMTDRQDRSVDYRNEAGGEIKTALRTVTTYHTE